MEKKITEGEKKKNTISGLRVRSSEFIVELRMPAEEETVACVMNQHCTQSTQKPFLWSSIAGYGVCKTFFLHRWFLPSPHPRDSQTIIPKNLTVRDTKKIIELPLSSTKA